MPKRKLKEVTPPAPEASEQAEKIEKVGPEEVFDLVITRSYSRKLNLSIHGGAQYETLDILEQRTARCLDATKANAVSGYLYNECREGVERAILEYDNVVAETIDPTPKKEKKTTVIDDLGMSQDEVQQISPIINKMVSAETKEQLETVGEEIAAMSPELSKTQLDYLRVKFNKKANVLK